MRAASTLSFLFYIFFIVYAVVAIPGKELHFISIRYTTDIRGKHLIDSIFNSILMLRYFANLKTKI